MIFILRLLDVNLETGANIRVYICYWVSQNLPQICTASAISIPQTYTQADLYIFAELSGHTVFGLFKDLIRWRVGTNQILISKKSFFFFICA